MFGMVDGLDDEPVVAREVEERARFACSRAKASAPDLQIRDEHSAEIWVRCEGRKPRADPIYGGFSHTKALSLSSNVSNTNKAPTPSRSGDRDPDGETQPPSKHRRRVARPGQKQEYAALFSSGTKGLTWAAQLAEDVLGRETE